MSHVHVLVTGGSGFIAGHCLLQLLQEGYRVRTTLRSPDQEARVRRSLTDAGVPHGSNLSFVTADLLRDEGWAEATHGVDTVMHVASPVLPGHVDHEDDAIVPAHDGTLRVLRAARRAGVRRVVLTSAFHAVSWGHPRHSHAFTEADWSNLQGPGVDAYTKAKTLAERAAWDFIAREGDGMQLTTLLPVAIVGPIMGPDISGANRVILRMLMGDMPGLPNLHLPIVDVRDVARAHVLAMSIPAAAGERFLLSNGPTLPMREIADILRAELGQAAYQVPRRLIPDWVMRIMAIFKAEVRPFVHDLGYAKRTNNAKATQLLGWHPRNARIAVAAAGRSLAAMRAFDDTQASAPR